MHTFSIELILKVQQVFNVTCLMMMFFAILNVDFNFVIKIFVYGAYWVKNGRHLYVSVLSDAIMFCRIWQSVGNLVAKQNLTNQIPSSEILVNN